MFSLIENLLKHKKTITIKSVYDEVFGKFGTIKGIGRDWSINDWREEAIKYVKKPAQLLFKISKVKELF